MPPSLQRPFTSSSNLWSQFQKGSLPYSLPCCSQPGPWSCFPESSCLSLPLPRIVYAEIGLRSLSKVELQKLGGGGKPSATNNRTRQLGILRAECVPCSGSCEPAAEPGLRALSGPSVPPTLRPEGAPGTPGWAFEGGRVEEQECRIRRNREIEAEQVPQSAEEESLLAPHIFGRGGAGPRKG